MKKYIIMLVMLSCFFLASCGNTEKPVVTTTETTTTEAQPTEATEVSATEASSEATTEKATEKITEEITVEITASEAINEQATEPTTAAKETAAEKSLKKLRNQLKKKNAYVAVAYAGYYEGNFKQIKSALKEAGITKEYPFIKDIAKKDFYSLEGNEVYIVVPKEKVDICVYEYDFNEEGIGSAVKEFNIYNDGTPFILKGNISDIMPDFQLVARVNNKTKLEYNPCLSLENGKLQQSKGVYDFSPYDKLPFFEEVTEEERNEPFCGVWYGEAEYGNGGIASMTLTLNSDTTAAYKYGDPFSDCIESFEGTWNEITGILALNLEGGPTDTDGLSQDEAVYSLTPVFSWRMEDGNLILTHEQGDVILYNTEGVQFTFSRVE